MKQLITILAFVIFGTLAGHSQAFDQIFRELGQNNLTSLEPQMAADIELCIADSPDFFSKEVAIQKIQTFLAKQEVTGCKMIHSGKSADKGSKYWVGKLTSKKGTYRVFLYVEGGEIIEIRLDNFDS